MDTSDDLFTNLEKPTGIKLVGLHLVMSPWTILVWTFYIIPIWVLGWVRKEEDLYDGWIFVFKVIRRPVKSSLHARYLELWRRWAGWSGPMCMIIADGLLASEDRVKRHEAVHCYQQFYLSWLFYIPSSIYLWLFERDKHAYLDNPYEREARRVAGQPVNIPRHQWPFGVNDRWPWW